MAEQEAKELRPFEFAKTTPIEKDFAPKPVSSDADVVVPKDSKSSALLRADSQALELELNSDETEDKPAVPAADSESTPILTPTTL